MIEEIKDKQSKRHIARSILEALTDWFEITESREQYIKACEEQIFVVAKKAEKEIGFICLKETGNVISKTAILISLKFILLFWQNVQT